jgi:hypothetical protein
VTAGRIALLSRTGFEYVFFMNGSGTALAAAVA